MTKIDPARPVKRETAATLEHRPILVELHPKCLHLRLKGERGGSNLSYEAAMRLAWRLAGEAAWRERHTGRMLRRVC